MRVAAVVPRRSGKIPDEPFDLQRWCDSPSVAPFSGYALCAAAEAVEDAGIGSHPVTKATATHLTHVFVEKRRRESAGKKCV